MNSLIWEDNIKADLKYQYVGMWSVFIWLAVRFSGGIVGRQ
jgi:hypothetical protein